MVSIGLKGIDVKALIDTGCEQSVICDALCRKVGLQPQGPRRIVQMLNGECEECPGEVSAEVTIEG